MRFSTFLLFLLFIPAVGGIFLGMPGVQRRSPSVKFPAASLPDTHLVQKIHWLDTTWTHKPSDADLVLEVRVLHRWYMSWSGTFYCKVIRVLKGDSRMDTCAFSIGMIETTSERFEKRFSALLASGVEQKNIYLAFTKAAAGSDATLVDKSTGLSWDFFMSSPFPDK
ncbi:MAG TPA: hypothetical protein VI112_12275 [Bacteroidia bacterium]|jgi:hypothetical protein